ncbi:multidrug transporter [Tistrella bauzanensis]|uniref:Multidrug transporter n=1 Tax=Tistrella bauzanensis TaxID=657419 RepID=A0ABQ1I7D4_9PROT|nr:efflux RND transporter permease subunit [Tistrella bauzanensis]GGB24182.1 multidrug transporter [Tistrella bauzanensis]
MILSDVSIKRPVFATVLSLLLIVVGLAAGLRLAVREYPDVDTPQVSVGTSFRGAPASLVETQVTEIIEGAVSGIEGIRTLRSVSRDGRSFVNIEFNVERDLEAATNDVRDKVAQVIDDLPETAEQPIISKADADSRPMLWMTLTSNARDALALTDYADRFIVDRLSVVPGVASVYIGGERRYAMRIWIDRQALSARGLTVNDVTAALNRENLELPAGSIETTNREVTIRTDTRFATEADFRQLVVSGGADGRPIRLGDIARIEVGAEDYKNEIRSNGQQGIGVGVIRQSKANTLDVANGVRAEVEALRTSLPPDMTISYSYDESLFISEAIYEVMHALVIALLLVVGIIFVFLRSIAATLVPAVAIPVSVIASLTVLGAMGFSINVLTLLALVLAIGLVVDDAIVVLENIHRRIEDGEPPLLAAYRGARQIAFAVIATTLVLIAVFVPISFMEGRTGRLFGEFGIAMAASVAFSMLVALTLTPMMCSKLLRAPGHANAAERGARRFFDGLNTVYDRMLGWAMGARLVVLAVAVALSAVAGLLYEQVPKEFAPTEDRGSFIVVVEAPQGSSYDYTSRNVEKVEQILQPLVDEGVASTVFTIVSPGSSRPAPVDRAFVIVRLVPWAERTAGQVDLVNRVRPQLTAIPGVRAVPVNPPGLGQRGFSNPLEVVVAGLDREDVKAWRDIMMDRLLAEPGLNNVNSDYEETKPQLDVTVDRERAAALGISAQDIGSTLEVMFGSRTVTRFEDRGEQYDVVLQAENSDRASAADLSSLFVRAGTDGSLVPLSNLVRMEEVAVPKELRRVDRLPAITISAGLADGYGLGNAVERVQEIAATNLPPQARISFDGQSREYVDAGAGIMLTFALSILIVFLVLAAQFESWIHPVIILLAVPLALTGGLAGIWLSGGTLNIYSQIGMVMLIGLMAKNGILIVEFANQLRDEDGLSPAEAARKSAVLRLRPILMTTIATVLGAVPLAMGSGAGVESRSALAVVVIGGMTLATIMTLFLVPVLYAMLAGFTKPAATIANRLLALDRQPATAHVHQDGASDDGRAPPPAGPAGKFPGGKLPGDGVPGE